MEKVECVIDFHLAQKQKLVHTTRFFEIYITVSSSSTFTNK